MNNARITSLKVSMEYIDKDGNAHARDLIDWKDKGDQKIEADFRLGLVDDTEKTEIGPEPVRVWTEFQMTAKTRIKSGE